MAIEFKQIKAEFLRKKKQMKKTQEVSAPYEEGPKDKKSSEDGGAATVSPYIEVQ